MMLCSLEHGEKGGSVVKMKMSDAGVLGDSG